jgi:site-specific recombinase XerD
MTTETEYSVISAVAQKLHGASKAACSTYLRPDEARKLIEAAGKVGRQGLRDRTLVQLLYRHGLRCREGRLARWSDFDLDDGPKVFRVRRAKGGATGLHHLDADEVRCLRKLRSAGDGGAWVFVSERGGPISADTVARVVQRAGEAAGLGAGCHPHMLRHSAGYALINDGVGVRHVQAFLGHRSIQSTVAYTALDPRALAEVRVR